MFDGRTYPIFKVKPFRGSRVRKLLKWIKRSKKQVFKSKREIHYFLEDDMLLKAHNHGKFVALQTLKRYIKESFDVDSLVKRDFNKKAFAGVRMAILLEYLDHQMTNTNDAIESLDELVVDEDFESYLRRYLIAQYIIYRDFHSAIYTGEIESDIDEDSDEDL